MLGFGKVYALVIWAKAVPGGWEGVLCGGEERNGRHRGDPSKELCCEGDPRNVAAAKQGCGSWRKGFLKLGATRMCVGVCVGERESLVPQRDLLMPSGWYRCPVTSSWVVWHHL